jgi:D-sedoheptulose 7-phosphate isomerase
VSTVSAPAASQSFSRKYLSEVAEIAAALRADELERMSEGLAAVRARGGRLFVLGVGGGAGHASHAVNDFRKLCGIEAYAPTDNVSELTARINDEGWETSYEAWLQGSRLSEADGILVFSVGGGSREHNVSMNLVRAVELAKSVGASVFGIVGKPDGTTAQLADVCIVVGAPAERRTPHVESFQAVLWHLLVSHPALAAATAKWESVERDGVRSG